MGQLYCSFRTELGKDGFFDLNVKNGARPERMRHRQARSGMAVSFARALVNCEFPEMGMPPAIMYATYVPSSRCQPPAKVDSSQMRLCVM